MEMFRRGGKVKRKAKKAKKTMQSRPAGDAGLRKRGKADTQGMRTLRTEGALPVSERKARSFQGFLADLTPTGITPPQSRPAGNAGLMPVRPQNLPIPQLSGAGFMNPSQFLLERHKPFFSYSTVAPSPFQPSYSAPPPSRAVALPNPAPPVSSLSQEIQGKIDIALQPFETARKELEQERKDQKKAYQSRQEKARRALEDIKKEDERRAKRVESVFERQLNDAFPMPEVEEKHAFFEPKTTFSLSKETMAGPPMIERGAMVGPLPMASPVMREGQDFKQQVQEAYEKRRQRQEKKILEKEREERRMLLEAERGLMEAMASVAEERKQEEEALAEKVAEAIPLAPPEQPKRKFRLRPELEEEEVAVEPVNPYVRYLQEAGVQGEMAGVKRVPSKKTTKVFVV